MSSRDLHDWLDVVARFAAQGRRVAAALDAGAGGRPTPVGIGIRALVGGAIESSWFWYKRAGGERSYFDGVLLRAEEEANRA